MWSSRATFFSIRRKRCHSLLARSSAVPLVWIKTTTRRECATLSRHGASWSVRLQRRWRPPLAGRSRMRPGQAATMTSNLAGLTNADVARWRDLSWTVLPAVQRTPQMNMALDEVLVERVGAGRRAPTLRVWAWSAPCVVLGRFQSVRNEVNEDAAARHGIEIVR